MITVIVMGLPGSGKSFFASRLASRLGALYISSDLERKKMLQERTYSTEEKLLVYDRLLKIMQEAIKSKESVVLDATFYKRRIRRKFRKAAGLASIVFIEVIASENIIRERLSSHRDDSDADYEVYEKIKASWEPMTSQHLVLQSAQDNINEMLEKAFSYIQRKDHDRK